VDAAARASVEETGWRPRPVRLLGHYHPSPGISDQRFGVCAGAGAERVADANPNEVERIEWVPVDRVRELIRNGEVDGLSLMSLLAFVGGGDGPCVIVMIGSRSGPGVRYPVSELPARYGASVAAETSDWRQAYATVERFRRERPPSWARLPWGRRALGS